MNVIFRAILAVRRKLARSLILLVLMILIFSALISEAVVKNSIVSLKENLNKNFRAGFTVSAGAKMGGGMVGSGDVNEKNGKKGDAGASNTGMTLVQAKEISKLEGIEATNFLNNELLASKKYKLVENERGGISLDKNKDSDVRILATFVNESKLYADFLNGRYEIKQGRGLEKEGENEMLVHEEFAQLNHVKLGDTLNFRLNGKDLKLKVVGIFAGKDSQSNGFASEMAENRLFVNFKTLEKMSKNLRVQQVSYFVKEPKMVEATIAKAKTLNLPWDNLNVSDNFEKNKGLYQTIENVEKLLNTMLIVISVVGILVLGFVLLFWFRGRIHEIGTLIAIGKTKGEVFLQLVMELIVIATISFVPAMLVGNLTSGVMTETILEQAESEETGNTNSLKVNRKELGPADYMGVYMLGLTVILLAIGSASISTMRLTPKQILTKMK